MHRALLLLVLVVPLAGFTSSERLFAPSELTTVVIGEKPR